MNANMPVRVQWSINSEHTDPVRASFHALLRNELTPPIIATIPAIISGKPQMSPSQVLLNIGNISATPIIVKPPSNSRVPLMIFRIPPTVGPQVFFTASGELRGMLDISFPPLGGYGISNSVCIIAALATIRYYITPT